MRACTTSRLLEYAALALFPCCFARNSQPYPCFMPFVLLVEMLLSFLVFSVSENDGSLPPRFRVLLSDGERRSLRLLRENVSRGPAFSALRHD